MKRYLVGGAVRDRLLGLPVKDRDWVVVGETAESLERQGFRRVGKSFPVFLHPETAEEHTLACRVRGDLTTADASVDIEADLRARDFTINAIAETAECELIDPRRGLDDLRARVLRPVSSQTFTQDPLRVLRMARLAAQLAPLGFTVAPDAQRAARQLGVRERLCELAGERVWAELNKALASNDPARFLVELRAVRVLEDVFPELDRLFGVPQPARWHPEIDTGVHILLVLKQAAALSTDVGVRFAALTHDLGKGTTPVDILPSHRGHEERGVLLIDQMAKRIRVPSQVCDLARVTARWHGHIHKAFELKPSTVVKVLEQTDAIRRPKRFEGFLLACEADFRGRTGFAQRPYPQADFFRNAMAATATVDAAAVAKRVTSAQVPEAIRRERIARVKQLPRPVAPD